MDWLSSLFAFDPDKEKRTFLLLWFFPVFTVAALWTDSAGFASMYFDGRLLTNILAILYFVLFFIYANPYLRKLLFCMVFLSYIGELIFFKALNMYAYRTSDIPLYVPFGHAIVYGSGFILAETQFFRSNENQLRKLFLITFSLLFLFVGLVLEDIFSLIFGTLFFVLMKRKKWQNLYYAIALCVIFIELVGTYFRCWTWVPKTFGIIPAVNPPMGAVFFYAGGDIILAKIVACWKSNVELKNNRKFTN